MNNQIAISQFLWHFLTNSTMQNFPYGKKQCHYVNSVDMLLSIVFCIMNVKEKDMMPLYLMYRDYEQFYVPLPYKYFIANFKLLFAVFFVLKHNQRFIPCVEI